jgi:hypothetical protein
VAETINHSKEQVTESKEEVATLKKKLAACMDAAKKDQPLLNSGLRLAMENAELRNKITGLVEEKTEIADSKFETSPTI